MVKMHGRCRLGWLVLATCDQGFKDNVHDAGWPGAAPDQRSRFYLATADQSGRTVQGRRHFLRELVMVWQDARRPRLGQKRNRKHYK